MTNHEIDKQCDLFEAAWQSPKPPRLEDFLSSQPDPELFVELLRVDLSYRRRRQDPPEHREYASRFPQFAEVIDECFSWASQRDQATPVSPSPQQKTDIERTGFVPPRAESVTESPRSQAVGIPLAQRYRLGAEIARGGMGVVHRATDLLFRREVAVKLLRPNWQHELDPVEQRLQLAMAIEAFRYEAEITARLQHPGIPPVHELGKVEDNLPFLAMKLIQGRTLQKLLDERTSPQHDLPRWINVFEQISQAAGYAHSEGIIHRDLKPLNVMVGAFGEVQVMDWGLAKTIVGTEATDETTTQQGTENAELDWTDRREFHSHQGDVKGTLQYMPPEQARGEIDQLDTRTDVFGLGAILCQILTGAPPFAGKTRHEIKRQAATGDLAAAHQSIRGCGADADLIDLAIRCLAPDASARPADGTAVAHAIAAHRATVEERLRKAETDRARSEQRRLEQNKQRWLWYGIALILTVLVIYYGTSNYVIAERNKRVQEEAATTAAINNFLNHDLLFLVGAEEQFDAGIKLDPNIKARELVLRAAKRIEGKFKDQPRVEARIRSTIGMSLSRLGEYHEAIKQWTRACEICKQEWGPTHPETIDAMHQLAVLYDDVGKLPEAKALYAETLSLQQAKSGENDSKTLETQGNYAITLFQSGEQAQAIELLEKTLKAQEASNGPDHPSSLKMAANLASMFASVGDLDRAIVLLKVNIERSVRRFGESHPEVLDAKSNLAGAYLWQGKPELALGLYEETLKMRRKTQGDDNPATIENINNVAAVCADLGQLERALPLFEEAWNWHKVKLGAENEATLAIMVNVATVNRQLGQVPRAVKLLEEALSLQETNLRPDHPALFKTKINLANAYLDSGKTELAKTNLEEAVRGQRRVLAPSHPHRIPGLIKLADFYQDASDWKHSIPLLIELIDIFRAHPTTFKADLAATSNKLGEAYSNTEQPELAIPYYKEALDLLQANFGKESDDTFDTLDHLAVAYLKSGQHDLGIPLLVEALEIQRKVLEPASPFTLRTMGNLANAYLETDQPALALPLCQEALDLKRSKATGAADVETIRALLKVVFAETSLKKFAAAEAHLLEAYEAAKGLTGPERKFLVTGIIEELVNVLEAAQKPTEAAKWKEELKRLEIQ